MSGIYGICEPGVQLQSRELDPMSVAMRPQQEQTVGGQEALLGAVAGLGRCVCGRGAWLAGRG